LWEKKTSAVRVFGGKGGWKKKKRDALYAVGPPRETERGKRENKKKRFKKRRANGHPLEKREGQMLCHWGRRKLFFSPRSQQKKKQRGEEKRRITFFSNKEKEKKGGKSDGQFFEFWSLAKGEGRKKEERGGGNGLSGTGDGGKKGGGPPGPVKKDELPRYLKFSGKVAWRGRGKGKIAIHHFKGRRREKRAPFFFYPWPRKMF